MALFNHHAGPDSTPALHDTAAQRSGNTVLLGVHVNNKFKPKSVKQITG